MSDDLYERYKESLRVGHVAVLRGSLEAAVDAYRTAAEIAPSRALPHTSLGGVLLRLGKLDDALVEYAAAVARAPRDEGALLGQAEALGTAGRRDEAAKALDKVSELQAGAGRLPEAADTLRRAIELHETAERLERQQTLVRQVRLSAGDHAAEQLLARALRLRDESVAEPPAAATPVAWTAPADASAPSSEAVPREAAEPEPVLTEARVDDGVDVAGTVEAGDTTAPEELGEVRAVPTDAEEALPEPADSGEPAVAATFDDSAATTAASAAGADQPADAGSASEGESRGELGSATLSSRFQGWRGWWSEEASPGDELAARPAETAGTAASASPADDALSTTASSSPLVEDSTEAAATDAHEESLVAATASVEATGTDSEPLAEAETLGDAQEPPAESEPVGVMVETGVAEDASGPSADALLAAAEAADTAGDATQLRSLLLETARACGREHRYEAAIDAANRVLRASPSDLEAHLVLVDLYMARDWSALAIEKLELLARLAELSDDEDGRRRVSAAAAAAFPNDERFGAAAS